jgi:hypothetical protein
VLVLFLNKPKVELEVGFCSVSSLFDW